MQIEVLIFGQITDITGKANFQCQGVENTDELRQQLMEKFPELKSLEYSMAVNKKIIRGNCSLKDRDTVALLPPFSGG